MLLALINWLFFFLCRVYSNSTVTCCQPGQPVALWELRRRLSIPILCPGKPRDRVNLVGITGVVVGVRSKSTTASSQKWCEMKLRDSMEFECWKGLLDILATLGYSGLSWCLGFNWILLLFFLIDVEGWKGKTRNVAQTCSKDKR